MKVTIIRKRGKNETITRHPLEDIALFIQNGWRKHTVTELSGKVASNWSDSALPRSLISTRMSTGSLGIMGS